MKFMLACDEMDGLVFIDKSYLAELNSELLYAMDILLDPCGDSELAFDFPDEPWETASLRETKQIREFCRQGKMIIWLLNEVEQECSIEKSSEIYGALKWLHVPTGELLAVTASELIQCLPYPELSIEPVFELSLEGGWYAIWNEGMNKIMYCKKEPPDLIPSNIQEMFEKL